MTREQVSTAFKAADRYGVPAVFAAFLIWWLTQSLGADLKTQRNELHDHMFQTGFYMRTICVNMAIQAGQNPASCEPPQLLEPKR